MIRRGDLHWAQLEDPRGSGPAFRRPVVIVSSNGFNGSRIGTVLAVVVTSNTRLREAPGNVFLPAGKSGLPRDSVINVSRVVTLDKRFVGDRINALPRRVVQRLDAGLRLCLGLSDRP